MLSGVGAAVAAAAAVLVIFGGISLFTGGGGGTQSQPAAVPTTALTTSTSIPSASTVLATIGAMMGGEPLQDEELDRFTGPTESPRSGYLIESTTALGAVYELGLIVYQEGPESGGSPMICFSEYAITQGVNVGGGAQCVTSQEKAEEVAEFGLSAGGTCGAIPKEEPVVEGNWLTLAVWGIPQTTESLTVGLDDGTDVEIGVRDGVALHIWEREVAITAITFDDITQAQEELISSYLPIEGISDDCNQSDGTG